MTITLDREPFAAALATATRAVPRTPHIQILSCIHIHAANHQAAIRGTDASLEITTRTPADGEGEFCINAHTLSRVVQLLRGDTVTLDNQHTGSVFVNAGQSRYTFHTHDTADYPAPATRPSALETIPSVPANEFTSAAHSVLFAASQDASRPVLSAVRIRISEDGIRMDATDSYRLATIKIGNGTPPVEFLMQASDLAEALKLIKTSNDTSITLGVSNNTIRIETTAGSLTTRRVDGQYPDVDKIIPTDYDHEVILPRIDTLDAIKRAGIMLEPRNAITLTLAENQLQITSRTVDVGGGSETIPCEWNAPRFEIGFQPEYLVDALNETDADQVTLHLTTPLRPGVITSTNTTRHLIMPVRLPGA